MPPHPIISRNIGSGEDEQCLFASVNCVDMDVREFVAQLIGTCQAKHKDHIMIAGRRTDSNGQCRSLPPRLSERHVPQFGSRTPCDRRSGGFLMDPECAERGGIACADREVRPRLAHRWHARRWFRGSDIIPSRVVPGSGCSSTTASVPCGSKQTLPVGRFLSANNGKNPAFTHKRRNAASVLHRKLNQSRSRLDRSKNDRCRL